MPRYCSRRPISKAYARRWLFSPAELIGKEGRRTWLREILRMCTLDVS